MAVRTSDIGLVITSVKPCLQRTNGTELGVVCVISELSLVEFSSVQIVPSLYTLLNVTSPGRKKQKTRKALGERKPPTTFCQFFRCIRQVAALSGGGLSYLAVVENPSILSWIQTLIRITNKIQSPLSWAKSNLPCKFQPNPPVTFCVILLTNQQRETNKRRVSHNLLYLFIYSVHQPAMA